MNNDLHLFVILYKTGMQNCHLKRYSIKLLYSQQKTIFHLKIPMKQFNYKNTYS